MKWFVAALALCAIVPSAHCASRVAWCYHLPTCNDTQWATIAPRFCNGSRQSPIDIVTANAKADSSLTAFTFHNYSSNSSLVEIKNTGKTVKVTLASGLGVTGGGLKERYDSLQFHLHWGNGTSVPGSEHTVNGKRYPMELHIVNSASSFNGNTTLAIANSTGLAALGFLIEVMPGTATGQPASWKTLSSYLANITTSNTSVPVKAGISLQDLLVGVNTTNYYRYLGSLTTPNCNEAVVWTVFKDTIKVSEDVINSFSRTVRIGNSSSEYMTNVFRNVQPAQRVTTQPSSSSASAPKSCYSLGLMALSFLLGRS
ncbi:carbonic anhydrase XVb [Plectropomus leopardus]|uniref:carbonic anhydrase XVb n=1 Tax=Plectropomus leopardus TaxID=160734 RepID=UPI001C4B6FC1|nr:carbonic anhydrase XVb [Plectropomus leopardus]